MTTQIGYLAYNETKNGKNRQLTGRTAAEAAQRVLDWMRANGSRSKTISITEGELADDGCFSCMILSAKRWTIPATAEGIATLPAPVMAEG